MNRREFLKGTTAVIAAVAAPLPKIGLVPLYDTTMAYGLSPLMEAMIDAVKIMEANTRLLASLPPPTIIATPPFRTIPTK